MKVFRVVVILILIFAAFNFTACNSKVKPLKNKIVELEIENNKLKLKVLDLQKEIQKLLSQMVESRTEKQKFESKTKDLEGEIQVLKINVIAFD